MKDPCKQEDASFSSGYLFECLLFRFYIKGTGGYTYYEHSQATI